MSYTIHSRRELQSILIQIAGSKNFHLEPEDFVSINCPNITIKSKYDGNMCEYNINIGTDLPFMANDGQLDRLVDSLINEITDTSIVCIGEHLVYCQPTKPNTYLCGNCMEQIQCPNIDNEVKSYVYGKFVDMDCHDVYGSTMKVKELYSSQ